MAEYGDKWEDKPNDFLQWMLDEDEQEGGRGRGRKGRHFEEAESRGLLIERRIGAVPPLTTLRS